jgi:hypothetical protein
LKASGVFDTPIEKPDDDLLEMSVYARPLADFIFTTKPPFTIGIYGEWGSGKTSFVRLLEHFLENSQMPGAQPVRFISFSAWPYRTSDEIWRALVLLVARRLYEVPDPLVEALGTAPGPEPRDLFTSLSRFLSSDALVLRAPSEPPDPLAAYKDLVARLDRSQTTIARGADQVHTNGDEKLIALVKAAASALGTLSPLIAGIRSLFGLEEKIDLAGLFHRDANQTARERIESVVQFQQIFYHLFETRASKERVCVFIDDLDRTMPDLALDLLEAVKIFFGGVSLVFIVAADEHLIGQGLRLRYHDLLHQGDSTKIQEFFDQKGREYFEKCIQLGIRVPQRTAQQTHRFLSAQFPQWLPATDIIQIAIGDNPRRLKQYCNWLQYKQRAVGEQTVKTERTEEFDALLEKIVSMHAWSPGPDAKLLACLRRAAAAPLIYAPTLAHVESRLAALDQVQPSTGREPAIDLESEIYDLAVSSSTMRDLFEALPLLSSASPSHVAVLVELAELAPDSETMLKSGDACFMRIMEIAARQGLLSEDRLLLEDFTRLIAIAQKSPKILDWLHEIASGEGWTKQLLDLEEALRSEAPESVSALAPAAAPILAEVSRQSTVTADELRRLLLGPPALSALLREEFALFWDFRSDLPDPATLLNVKFAKNLKEQDRNSTLAQWMLEERLRDEPRKKEIASWLKIRIQAAKHLLKLRTFAKLDAFTHCWPDLASSLRIDLSALIALESQALQPQQALPPGLERLWDQYRRDDRLLAFLKLRPLFRDIPRQERDRFLLMAQATEAHTPAVKESRPLTEDLQPTFEEVQIAIREAPGKDPEHLAYGLSISSPLGNALAEVELSSTKLQQAVAFLYRFDRSETAQRDQSPQFDFATQLRELGELLFRSVFQGKALELISLLLEQPTSWRFLWDFNAAPQLMNLPWECIYAPAPLRTFFALTRRYSLVRSLPTAAVQFDRAFAPPLRLLAVFPAPRDSPPLNSEGEEEILRRCIAEGGGEVQLDVLGPGTATWEKLKEKFETFRPHIFHFVGHGAVEGNTGALMLEDARGGGRILEASDMATLLRDSKLNLAVLNACDTGTAPTADAITSLAGALIQAGVSAVVGTTRKVPDDAALLFTREFYRSFLSGLPVEGAIVEARKALSIEKWDWSLYALFSNLPQATNTGSPAISDLGSLRLPHD